MKRFSSGFVQFAHPLMKAGRWEAGVVIEIESYQGDIKLYGNVFLQRELRKQIDTVEELYDRGTDNFVALLCRLYGWMETDMPDKPDYIYDRDTGKLLKMRKGN